MTDDHGTVVRAMEKAQALVTKRRGNQFVAQYRQGSSRRDRAAAFDTHHRTAAKHLARRGEQTRPHGLQSKLVEEATLRYASGMLGAESARARHSARTSR